MINIFIGILVRIFSNSYLNVFQKKLTNNGEKSSVVNFYTYLGLSVLGIFFLKAFDLDLIPYVLLMGFLGALGNYFIIKALSIGELSTLAPINSYKPIVAMLVAFVMLKEIPTRLAVCGIFLIILGTYYIKGSICGNKAAIIYRVLALICSGSEAVVIKKIILVTGVTNCFVLWAIAGFLFSGLFVIFAKYRPVINDYRNQIFLVITVGIMQYSTNYVFAKMNVSYALALFQLSTLLSVFLGANIFKESGLRRKLIGSAIMLIGAVVIIIS